MNWLVAALAVYAVVATVALVALARRVEELATRHRWTRHALDQHLTRDGLHR